MAGVNLQSKKFPLIYNYKNEYLCTLNECIKINETQRLGDISSLTFEYPIYQVDVWNETQKDSRQHPLVNPKCQYIVNDNRVLFDGKWYVIKVDEDNRDDSGRLTINCECHEIGINLQELTVQSLRIIPPLDLPVNATNAINQVLIAAQHVRENKVISASGNTVTLDQYAHPTDGYYAKYRIYINSGKGAGQTRYITSYNGTTKQIAVDTPFSPQPDTTSTYMIWNPIWNVGTIDSVFDTALRSHEFDFTNAWDALQQVRDKYLNSNDEVGYLKFRSVWDNTYQKWDNRVDLVQATPYNSIDLRYRKNIKSIIRRQDSSNLYTRVIPQGVDNLTIDTIATENRTDSSITYPTHIANYNYVDNFKYFLAQGYTYKECVDNHVKIYRFDDSRYTDALSLYADSKKLLEKSSTPKLTYIVSALDLSRLAYGSARSWEQFKLGDIIKIIDEDLSIDIFATISSIDRDWNNPQNAQIEITNYVDNLSDIMKRIINRNDKYSDLVSNYGNTATYIIADKLTSKNWRQATYVVKEGEDAGYVIRKVIESIDENKGGRIVLLDGTYNCSSSIELRNNISIEGQGTATRIIGNSSLLGMGLSGTALVKRKNISIKSLYMSTFQDCINVNYCDNVSIKNVVLENAVNNFIIVQNSINVDVSNNVVGNQSQVQGKDGIDIKTSSNVIINNNTIYSVDYRNINIESASGETTISNNYLVHNQATGADFGCIFVGLLLPIPVIGWQNTTQLYNINILNNTINSNSIKSCIDVWNERNIIINGNKLMDGKNGIRMINLLDCKVFNNLMISTSATYDGIEIDRIGDVSLYRGRSEIQGNTVYNTSGAFGIYLGASAISDMFITNNDLKYSCTNPAVNGLFLNGNTVTTSAGNRL